MAALIRTARKDQGLSQQDLAKRCGVSRKFIGELETGKENASLGLALKVINHLEIDLHAHDDAYGDSAPHADRGASAHTITDTDDPQGASSQSGRTSFAVQFEDALSAQDYPFALRLLGEYAGASLSAGRAEMAAAPRIGDEDYLIALAGISRWVSIRTATDTPGWASDIQASRHPIFPAEKLHPVSDRMKDLIRRETPPELAGLNVWMRERDLGRV